MNDDIEFPPLRVWNGVGATGDNQGLCTADEKMLELIATKQQRNSLFLRALQDRVRQGGDLGQQQALPLIYPSPGAERPAIAPALERSHGIYYRLPNVVLQHTPSVEYDKKLTRLPVILHPPAAAAGEEEADDLRRWQRFVDSKAGGSAEEAAPQRSSDWYSLRRGALATSLAPAICADRYYQPLNAMLVRLLLNQNVDKDPYTDWSAYMGDRAFAWYKSSKLQAGETLEKMGSFYHTTTTDSGLVIPWVSSPDGVVRKDGKIVRLLEIQCPAGEGLYRTSSDSMTALLPGAAAASPPPVWYQVQACMGLGLACGRLDPTTTPSTDVLVFRSPSEHTLINVPYQTEAWEGAMRPQMTAFFAERFWPEVRAALRCSQQMRELLPPLQGGGGGAAAALAGGGSGRSSRYPAHFTPLSGDEALLEYVELAGL